MSMLKSLAGKKSEKKVRFMDADVNIYKLSVANVMKIQQIAKDLTDNPNDEENFNILKHVISEGVEGGNELTDEDFHNFPLDELSRLSNEVLKFSGIQDQKGKSN